MGCIKTKEAGPDKQTENGGGEGGFQPMRQKKNITKAESIIVSQADFVLSWKDVSMFTQNYTLDRNVIGEGKFALQPGLMRFRGVWCRSQVSA